jgi:hypothetical protein
VSYTEPAHAPGAPTGELTIPDQPVRSYPEAARDAVTTGRVRLGGWLSSGGWMSVLAVVVVVVAPVLLIVPLLTHGGIYSNWGDGAANELSVQNAAHLHQAVGPYDRFGWFHPGPLLFYLTAVPYVLMGWNGAGLEVGAGLINLAAAVGIVALVARRAGGKAALGVAAVVCAFEFALDVRHITNVWGPEVIILPAALYFLLCADLAAGGVWSLVGAVVVGSFLVQTEIGTASPVAVGLLLAAAVRLIVWVRAGTVGRSLRQARWPGLVSLVAGALIWVPPLWQQLTGTPGNLGAIMKYFLHVHGRPGAREALSVLAGGMDAALFGWFGHRTPTHHREAILAILLVCVVGVAVMAWRRRQWLAFALAAGILPLTAAFFVSLLRVVGPIPNYLVLWSGALTLSAGIAFVLCVASPGRPLLGLPDWNNRARFMGALLLAGCAVVSGWRLSDSAFRVKTGSGYVNVTQASQAVEHLVPGRFHRLLVCITSSSAWPSSAGVVANLRKEGRDARVDPQWLYVVGRELAPSGREQVAVFLDTISPSPPRISVKPETTTRAGDLDIRIFRPTGGDVSASLCPKAHLTG